MFVCSGAAVAVAAEKSGTADVRQPAPSAHPALAATARYSALLLAVVRRAGNCQLQLAFPKAH